MGQVNGVKSILHVFIKIDNEYMISSAQILKIFFGIISANKKTGKINVKVAITSAFQGKNPKIRLFALKPFFR